mmetsp:Transcript_36670/g.47374  ORF Transcript_36670/g.47374 Transcript_36670/m.47374 type:complete len:238 (+) Transcript_36670:15-728(+)
MALVLNNTSNSQPPPAASIDLKIQNVVGSCRIIPEGNKLTLKTLATAARNTEYSPKRFAAVIMRLRDPKSTALIFESGKMVVLGAKEENQGKIAARKFARIVKLCDVCKCNVKVEGWKVSNMVAVANCNFPIRLEGLALAHLKFVSYEPELFPGLIYRLANPKITLLVFVSGKVVITGAKSQKDLKEGFEKLWYILHEHRKQHLTSRPSNNNTERSSSSSSSSNTSNVSRAIDRRGK